jgi:hypothetical protein
MRGGAGNAGNVNMRGRGKFHLFSCKCCFCYDDREELREKIADREVEETINEIEGQ